jgi:hypothetical protein
VILRIYTLWSWFWLVLSMTEHAPRFFIAFFAIATLLSTTAIAARGAVRYQERHTLDRRRRLLAQRDAARAQREAERSQFLDRVKAESLPAHEADLDVSNPTSVVRRRLASGGVHVPLGPCECPAYPRRHKHAGTPAERAVVAQHHTVRPAVKPCTEGGPCRAADREIAFDPRGNRVGSLCTKCDRRRAWLPFLENGAPENNPGKLPGKPVRNHTA